MANLTRKTTVLAKQEATYKASTTLSASTDALLLTGDGAGVVSQDTTVVDTPVLRASIQPQSPLIGRSLSQVSVSGYLMTSRAAGAGADEILPWCDHILKGVGLEPETGDDAGGAGSTSSSAIYRPVETPKSTKFEVYADQIKHTITGAYGSAFNLNFTAGSTATFDATFSGTYEAPVADTSTTFTYPSDNKKLVESEALTIGSYSPIVRSMAVAISNTVSERTDANSTYGFYGLALTGRASSTLDLVIEVPADQLTTFDPFGGTGQSLYNTGDNIQFTHKTSASEFIVFDFASPQLTAVSYADDGGVRTYNLSYALFADDVSDAAGRGSEITVTFKRGGLG
jgi:hypothetical protein